MRVSLHSWGALGFRLCLTRALGYVRPTGVRDESRPTWKPEGIQLLAASQFERTSHNVGGSDFHIAQMGRTKIM